MADVQQAARYYRLLAETAAASGHDPHQARVYDELAALVAQCSSEAEITERMRANGFFESPAQAKVCDTMQAHRDAATALGFTALAAIYERQLQAVQADYGAASATAWPADAQQELGRIGRVVDGFNELMATAFELRCAHAHGRPELRTKLKQIVRAIQDEGERLKDVVSSPYYRKHSPLSDAAYRLAIQTVAAAVSRPADDEADKAALAARADALLEAARQDKAELASLQQAYSARQRRSVNLCVAPDDAPGPYTYEAFYEGEL